MADPRNDNPSDPKQVQGEGDYEATRRYRKRTEEFLETPLFKVTGEPENMLVGRVRSRPAAKMHWFRKRTTSTPLSPCAKSKKA